MFHFMNFVRPFVNYAIFRELCDRMRFEVDCAKSHHRVISGGLNIAQKDDFNSFIPAKITTFLGANSA